MATRVPFLTTPYSGYLHNEVPPEDEELTHVGPGTPGGGYVRRFWHPVIRSDALQDLPVRIRILGEDLVGFRDQRGLSVNTTGWCSPTWGRQRKGPLCLSWALLTRRDAAWCLPCRTYLLVTGCSARKTSWTRLTWSFCTPSKAASLPKNSNCVPSWTGWTAPRGSSCTATRRVGDKIWLRMNEYLPPNLRQFGGSRRSVREVHVARARTTTWSVPLDDTYTMILGFRRLDANEEPPTHPGFGQTADRSYPERQRVPGDYDAQTSIHDCVGAEP